MVLPSLEHLTRLCDDTGLIEHAWLSVPRRESGYTTDDNGRLLVVMSRPDWSLMGAQVEAEATRLANIGVGYLKHASLAEGHGFRNRMSFERRWIDNRGSDDSYGRALWGLGTLAARTEHPELREAAHTLFWSNYLLGSVHSRAVAYAILGAAEMASLDGSAALRRQLRVWADQLPKSVRGRSKEDAWRWPEERLTYDNARLSEALIRAGQVLNDEVLVIRGLLFLEWLVEIETSRVGNFFSFTPTGGRGPGDATPAFDQQPIEAWAMVDACGAAAEVSGGHWLDEAAKAVAWFLGRNDLQQSMIDLSTGAGYDGLTSHGPNRNQGAESTLAALGALTHSAAGVLREQPASNRSMRRR
jgi:hypothetical protein